MQRRVGRRPYNPVSGEEYRGIVSFALTLQGYKDPRWISREQGISEEWILRRGETGTPVEVKGQASRIELLVLFNAEQFEMMPALELRSTYSNEHLNRKAQLLLRSSGASLFHVRDTASFFSSLRDEIHLALREQYADASDYYGTALLELCHWTNHPSRLNRAFGAASEIDSVVGDLRAHIANWMLSEELGTPVITASDEAISAWIDLVSESPEILASLFHDAAQSNCLLLHLEDREAVAASIALAAQALSAQALVERIAEAKEPTAQLIEDAKAYTAEYRDASDSLSQIIQRASESSGDWKNVRDVAKAYLAAQSAGLDDRERGVERQSDRSQSLNSEKEHEPKKPFLVRKESQGSGLDQVIIRGNSGKDTDQTAEKSMLLAPVNVPMTASSAVTQTIEQNRNFALTGPAGSSHLLNDLVVSATHSENSPTTEDILSVEAKPLQRKRHSRNLDSLER